MTPDIYEAHHRVRVRSEDAAFILRDPLNPILRRLCDDAIAGVQHRANLKAREWIGASAYSDEVLHNVWAKWSHDYQDIITTYTFADRDAAMLFKLSLD